MKNKYFYTLEYIVIYLVGMFIYSCSNSGPEPVKDPRKYTWTIDTISYPASNQTLMSCIWGSSTKDVYITGHNEDARGKMFHYDGKTWSEVKLIIQEGGTLEAGFSLNDIYGFGPNDIWAVGDRYDFSWNNPKLTHGEIIIHYDGHSWKEIDLDNKMMLSIWGRSPDDIYITGFSKYIWNYNGFSWKKDSIPLSILSNQINFQVLVNGNKQGDLFLLASSNCDNPFNQTRYFMVKNGDRWTLKDTYTTRIEGFDSAYVFIKLWVSPEGNLYSAGGFGIHVWKDEKWEKVFSPGGRFTVFYDIFGISENNMFAVGLRGNVYHYNGVNWHQFGQFADFDVLYKEIWTEGTEVFIVGNLLNSQKTIVLHGK